MDLLKKYLKEGGSFGKEDKEAEKVKKAVAKITDKLAQAGMLVAKLPNSVSRSSRGTILDGIGDAVDELNILAGDPMSYK